MKRIGITAFLLLATLCASKWAYQHLGRELVLAGSASTTYREDFQRFWPTPGDYSGYLLADPKPSIRIRKLSVEVVVHFETILKPTDMTNLEMAKYATIAERELAAKLRNRLVESLESRVGVVDNSDHKLLIIAYVDGYFVGGNSYSETSVRPETLEVAGGLPFALCDVRCSNTYVASARPEVFLLDVNSRQVVWFGGKSPLSNGFKADDLISSTVTDIQHLLG